MNYKIRKKERKDCAGIARVITVAWNETYRGIVSDEFLDSLYINEEVRAQNSHYNFIKFTKFDYWYKISWSRGKSLIPKLF